VSFFNFNKTLELTAYTCRPEVYNYVPVVLAKKYLPEWVRKSKSEVIDPKKGPIPTIKKCVGLRDLYRKGVVIPLWTDIDATINPIGEKVDHFDFNAADQHTKLFLHTENQFGQCPHLACFQHIKIESPWAFVANKNVQFLCLEPTWNYAGVFNGVQTLGASVSFNKQHATHVNMLLQKKEVPATYAFEFKLPLYHVIPLYDGDFKLNVELVSKDDYKGIHSKNTHLIKTNNYQKIFSTIGAEKFKYKAN